MCDHPEQIAHFRCSQLFGEPSSSHKSIEEDNITALRFDHSGKLLAVGDHAGRLILFNAVDPHSPSPQYDYHFEFQSHNKDFDTLKSRPIGQEISYINWLKPQGKYHKLLTANTSTVKLWKIYEKREKRMVKRADHDLSLPIFEEDQPAMSVNLKTSFPHKNLSPLNSVHLSKNEEYVFTTDESNVLLWSIEQPLKPYFLKQFSNSANRRVEKTQKITCAQMHPQAQTLFIYGTNKGVLGLNDIRTSVANGNTLSFNCQREENFLSEIINQYSSVLFLESTRKIITRDLISVKVWDMCNPTHPISTLHLDQNLKTRLCDLFEADCLDDKFKLTNSHGNILTGNYSDSFHVIDGYSGKNMQYQLDYEQNTRKRQVGSAMPHINPFNSKNKVLCHDYNKVSGQLVVSTHNCFFIYSKEQPTLQFEF